MTRAVGRRAPLNRDTRWARVVRRAIAYIRRRPSYWTLLEDGRWFAFEDVIPAWGEGRTEQEAIADLYLTLGEIRQGLTGRMVKHLVDQRRYLDRALR